MTPVARILIVEDDEGVARLEKKQLERAGYQAVTAGTAEEALAHVSRERFALMVLDYHLPGHVDGLRFHEQLRAAGHELPVILVTGRSDEGTAIRALRAGVRDFVTKSAEYIDYLPEAVSRVLAQVHTEQRLAESEARLSRLIAAAEDAFVVVEADGRISMLNPAGQRAFGLREREATGRRFADFCDLRPDGDGFLLGDEARRENGTTFPVEGTVSRVDLPGREFLTVILRDVSTRRATEDRQRKLETQLLHAQRMEAIGRLAGGVAHDFNNLLTVISGYSEILLQEMGPDDPLREPVVTMRDTGERAAALTAQLLTFSRSQVMSVERVDLNVVVGDFARMLRRLIGEDIDLVVRLSVAPCPVLADPRHLEQVVMNLVVNARDAMPTGGTVVLETDEVQFGDDLPPPPAVAPGRYVRLAVSDTGHGMPEDVRLHIFEPFFTTKQAGKGTGLGLSTVYGIVTQVGGHVDVYSEVGQGTVFKVYLPWAGDRAEAGALGRAMPNFPAGSEHVLVVEDDQAVRDIIAHVLTSHGYRVTLAANGVEALSLVEAGAAVDLVVSDVMMPEMSGPALVEALLRRHPQVRVLFLSGYTEEASALTGVRPASVAFLQKPFSFSALLTKTREVLQGPPR